MLKVERIYLGKLHAVVARIRALPDAEIREQISVGCASSRITAEPRRLPVRTWASRGGHVTGVYRCGHATNHRAVDRPGRACFGI